METIAHVLGDQSTWWTPEEPEEGAIVDLMESRGIEYTTAEGWTKLDEYEQKLGEPEGRARIKVVDRTTMLEVSLNSTD
jgi:ferredoxin--NADP+ reductase